MTEFDKDIPIPPNSRGGWPKKYYFEDMKSGESIFIKDTRISNITPVLAKIKKKYGFKFSARTTESGIRIWRIS